MPAFALLLTPWLLLCALSDGRTSRVPNVLSLPPFLAAAIGVLASGGEALARFGLTLLVFVLLHALHASGGADGRLLCVLAACSPAMLAGGLAAQLLFSIAVMATRGRAAPYPALPAIAAGAVLGGLGALL